MEKTRKRPNARSKGSSSSTLSELERQQASTKSAAGSCDVKDFLNDTALEGAKSISEGLIKLMIKIHV